MMLTAPLNAEPRTRVISLDSIRRAQRDWRMIPVTERVSRVKRLREALAENCMAIARKLAKEGAVEDFLAAQLIPFLDACRFLEKKAAGLLSVRRLRRSPLWLWGASHEVRREPHGVVLVIGPSNYPFFLPGVQALQGLVAGNSVVIKPGEGGKEAARLLAGALVDAGFPGDLLMVLGETPEAGKAVLAAGPDKVFLTGSAGTGISVLAQAAPRLTPCTMELSGCDAVFVLPDADLKLTARAISYGLRLNGGRTCIAPRRLIVWREVSEIFQRELLEAMNEGQECLVSDVDAEEFGGNRLAIRRVANLENAIAEYERSPYRLGASIFTSDLREAARLADLIDAGSICVNDLIVPTADGRLPFGGRGRSGFGSTRGAEGLLEMTRLKVVSTRHGNVRPHLRPRSDRDFANLARLTQFLYGGGMKRWKALFKG